MNAALTTLPCLCATARRTARALTQLYDGYLRESGIEAAQFTLLSVLKSKPGCSQNEIAEMLALDKTTLSRNLKVLERAGWIAPGLSGDDRRRRTFAVTRAGLLQWKDALPLWQAAQRHMRSRMKQADWASTWHTLSDLTDVARRNARRA